MTGSYPWKIADDFTTIVYVTNISDQQAEFIGQVNCDGGHFIIDPRKLAPGETAVFDLENLRDDQIADNAGARIPREASIGQFKWAIHGVTNGKLLLIGPPGWSADQTTLPDGRASDTGGLLVH